MVRFVVLAMLIVLVACFVPAAAQQASNFFDTTKFPNLQPVAGDIMIFAHGGVAKTCTVDQLTNGSVTLKVLGVGANYTALASAATANRTVTFPDVTGNAITSGDTGTVTNAMLAGSIAASKLVGTDIATVGTITSGIWNGTVISPTYGGNVKPQRLTADVTESAAALTNLADLSQSVTSGTNYVGTLVIKCVDSVAADGVQFDLSGGTATASYTWAGAVVSVSGGADTPGTLISTALNGVMNWTTFTGESLVVIQMSITASGTGTIIPRAAQNTHSTGTATFRKGSWFKLEPSAN